MTRIDAIEEVEGTPPIVSVSDLHGYLEDGRSALLAVGETDAFDPVVEADEDGRLHWADNDYVLVFDGDLIDRGPQSAGCVDLARRLRAEAPDGRVRYHVGNHELGLLFPERYPWEGWYCTEVGADERRRFYEAALEGRLSAAFGGYRFDYVHAGVPDEVDVRRYNDQLEEAAERLLDAHGTDRAAAVQRRIHDDYELFATGGATGRGPGAGPVWLDFEHLPADAPPQVVGHSRGDGVRRAGDVVCENVIRNNRGRPGGEAAVVETPDGIHAVTRTRDGGVERREL